MTAEQRAKYAVRPSALECRSLFEKAITAYRRWDKESEEPTLTDTNGNTQTLSVLCGYVWLNREIMSDELIEVFARLDSSLHLLPVARTYAQAARRLRRLIHNIVDTDIIEEFGLKPSITLPLGGARLH
jgi:hypothetical protein